MRTSITIVLAFTSLSVSGWSQCADEVLKVAPSIYTTEYTCDHSVMRR